MNLKRATLYACTGLERGVCAHTRAQTFRVTHPRGIVGEEMPIAFSPIVSNRAGIGFRTEQVWNKGVGGSSRRSFLKRWPVEPVRQIPGQ